MRSRRLLGLLVAFALLAGAPATAELPAGDEIARRINARDDGESMSRTLEMELVDKRGSTRVRSARVLRRWFGEEKRLAFYYLSPKTVEDTAFLVHDHPAVGREDDQWLYLPALRKVRRIAARDRGKNFLGTDMSYEDMKNETRVTRSDYTWKTLREEPCDDTVCLVLEATPLDTEIARAVGYGRITYWIDPAMWIARKVVYDDVALRHKKTALLSEFREVGGIWTVHVLEVRNHQTGHRTVFRSTEVDYQTELDPDWFTERGLRRGLP